MLKTFLTRYMTSVERGISVPLPHYTCCDFDLLRSRDVISQVTISLAIGSFLQVVNYNHSTSIMYGYDDTEPQIFWGHDSDLLGSRDVIGQVTIRLATYGFL